MSTQKLFESVVRIRNLDEFKPFREWLSERLDANVTLLVGAADETQMRQIQGAVRVYQQVIDLIEGSAKSLDKGRP